jgi:hypothetical protein
VRLTKFSDAPTVGAVIDFPKAERRLVGNPKRETWNAASAALSSGQLDTGVWRCEPGRWKIAFSSSKHEVFTVLSGRCRVHDDSGHFEEIGPGESLYIPPNFTGSFEVLETITKTYVIVE